MSSTTPLTDAINALTTYANETTGKSDTTLSDAVESLVDGYGGGGGGLSFADYCNGLADGTLDIIIDTSTTKFPPNTRLFNTQKSLKSVSFTALTSTEGSDYMFRNCTNLENVSFPVLTRLGQANAYFEGCSKLTSVDLKTVNDGYIGSSMFRNCTLLAFIDLGAPSVRINSGAFIGCSSLKTVVLRKANSVLPLYNINVFENTPFDSGGTGGTLYVPQSLISSYQSANNWSTILGYANNSIEAIEGSIYEI